jgi:cell division protein FtsL
VRQQNIIQAYEQTPWRTQFQVIGLFLLVLVMISLIAGIYLNVTARAATIGRKIQYMQYDIRQYQRLNADLETQLAALTAANQVEARAKELGFRRLTASEVTYIMVDGYPGRRGASLAPTPSPITASAQTLPPEFSQSLIDWLRNFAKKSIISFEGFRQ